MFNWTSNLDQDKTQQTLYYIQDSNDRCDSIQTMVNQYLIYTYNYL